MKIKLIVCIILLKSAVIFSQSKTDSLKRIEKTKTDSLESEYITSLDSLEFSLYGSGDLQNVFSSGEDKGSSVGNGSLGFNLINYFHHGNNKFIKFCFSASVTIASSNDTISEEFGKNILIPKKGLTSLELYAIWKPFINQPKLFRNLGFYGMYNLSSSVWKVISNQNNDTNFIKSTNQAVSLGVMYDLVGSLTDNKRVRLSIGFGLTTRNILGDLGFTSNEGLLQRSINSTQRMYWGTDFNFTLSIDNFKTTARYIYLLKGPNEQDISGLTKGQLLNSISLSTSVGLGYIKF